MKSSTKKPLIFSFVFFYMIAVLSFSTTLYAAQPISGAQGTQVQQMPQPTSKLLKATPSMISVLKYSNLPPEVNSAMSKLDTGYNRVQMNMPKLSKEYNEWSNTWKQCINKAYTYDDQKAAGCLPNDSVEVCLQKVVSRCAAGAFTGFIETYYEVILNLKSLQSAQDEMSKGLNKLHDYTNCLMDSWPKQICQ